MDMNELYNRQYQRIYRIAMLYLKNASDAEDAVHTVFLKYMEKSPKFESDSHEDAWFITVTRNYCKDQLKTYWRKHVSTGELPEMAIEEKEEDQLLPQIMQLPEKYREILYLYYYEGYSVHEMSELLSRKESTIQTQLVRARERLKKMLEKKEKSHRHSLAGFMPIIMAAAAVLMVCFSGGGINAAMGGDLITTLKELVGIRQSSQDVVGQAVEIQTRGIEIWAPEIYSIDEKYVIFGTLRGILVYDLEEGAVQGTIDVQAVDCIYFNSDPRQTHVLRMEDSLILFNSEDGEPYGNYYRYTLNGKDAFGNHSSSSGKTDALAIPVEEIGEDADQLQAYYDLWTDQQENYQDTFRQFADHEVAGAWIESGKSEAMYGRRALSWNDGAGRTLQSFLTIEESQYTLRTYDVEADQFTSVELRLGNCGESDAEQSIKGNSETTAELEETTVLPPFVYTGDDPAVAAICAYFVDKTAQYAEKGEVWIPAFIILDEIREDGEYLVFGNFWTYSYLLNGNILETSSGGEMPACFHLKETDDGYEIVSVDRTGDGADYDKGIREFAKGHPLVYMKFQSSDLKKDDARLEFIQMYVMDNHLNIQYYKDYGWDPVSIF